MAKSGIKILARDQISRIDWELQKINSWKQQSAKNYIQASLNGASYDAMSAVSSIMYKEASLKADREIWENLV